MTSILVIGKTGLLGQAIARHATRKGYDVITPSHTELDITSIPSIHRMLFDACPHIVVNCAAFNGMIKCEKNPEQAIISNGFAIDSLARECSSLGIKFVTFSTNYVFDGKKGDYIESDRTHPLQAYGYSKLIGEMCALKYSNSAVIRTSMLFGLDSSSRDSFIDRVLNQANKRDGDVSVWKNMIANLTYAEDLAEAVIRLVEQKEKVSGIYHLVNEKPQNLLEFTEYLLNFLAIKGVKVLGTEVTDSIPRPLKSNLLNIRAKEIGIELPPIGDAVERYLKAKGLI